MTRFAAMRRHHAMHLRWVAVLLVAAACQREATDDVQTREAAVLDVGTDEAERPPPPLEPGALGTGWADEVTQEDPVDDRDLDRDGVVADLDPDDESALVFPGATEVPCNGRDEDGDGRDWCPPDVDGDGAPSDIDCEDLDPGLGPFVREVQCNGRDENCDGVDSCDEDGDGIVDAYDPDPADPEVPEATHGEPLY